MDSVKNFRRVFCSIPQHENEYIIMIDSDPDHKKLLYCCLCMMEQSAQNSLPKTLKTFTNFINSTSEAFEKARSNAQSRGDAPPDFTDQISRKGEYLEKLTNNLNQQKTQLKIVFEKIREYVLKVIDEAEKEYEKAIGDELKAACDLFRDFERVVTTGWPKASDLVQTFPLQSEIEQRFAKANDFLQLVSLVEGFKGDIKADQMFSGVDGEKSRITHLENLIKRFKDIEANPPNIDLTELQIEKLEGSLREKLCQIVSQRATIQNSISKNLLSFSSLLQAKDLDLLRNWLPNKYELNLKLLYKSSVDGKSAADFHRKCDNKGPTITIIKCCFGGANKPSIFGGFTDQNWHVNSTYSISCESFVFSFTAQVKCPIIKTEYAIQGRQNFGPTFGGGHDIHVSDNFSSSSYCNPHSYDNSGALLDFPGYQGGYIIFQPEEVEVFSIN